MDKKIAFIGAGKVSTALGLYFINKGFEIQGYCSRNTGNAERAALLTHSTAYTSAEEMIKNSRMIWITTSDDQINAVVRQISQLTIPQTTEKLVLHVSGAHAIEILKPLKDKGYQTACAHPLLAFSDPVSVQGSLNYAWFAIEESEEGNGQLTDFFKQCGNRTLHINANKKTLYHAAACVLSNYLVTLLDVSHKIFEESGVNKGDIQEATMPLLESVIVNLKGKNCKDALTGPIKRGDENTVRMHLESLDTFMPEMTALYKLLGNKTMQMLGDYSLKKLLD